MCMDISIIKSRLTDLGYVVLETDETALQHTILSVEQSILNYINTKTIPKELELATINRICGEFLFLQKQCGKIIEDDFKSIKLGDVTVDFGGSGTSFDGMVESLRNDGDIKCCRKLKW